MQGKFYGPPDVQRMTRRAMALFRVVQDDPDFAWYGRFVALADFETGGVQRFLDLIEVQGASPAYWIANAAADTVKASVLRAGYRADRFEYVVSEGDSVSRARGNLSKYAIGDDVLVSRLGPDSPEADLDDFAEVAGAGGVLPPPEAVLRGAARKGVFLLARERATGRAISCAASIETFHVGSRRADSAFWGMLSTLPDWQGRKLALALGARAMVAMHEDNGFSKFITGVRAENEGSMALCAKLDMVPGKWCSYYGMDPAQFSSARVTK
ncbi:GNAT family N-acetyltransferase [Boseongicola aestuarii]|uniref:N-acetyltransferase domain-containing protein n=1 Tax=Boseongicola aestuarii TaxID=1470561 RepID=A0A238IV61_9RHOB|nr:hypothetical protein [Boseongicola aestuarii]SMX22349.1 hypothetical protein BOA8489_00441 [Boseongicola aestuarii]